MSFLNTHDLWALTWVHMLKVKQEFLPQCLRQSTRIPGEHQQAVLSSLQEVLLRSSGEFQRWSLTSVATT